MKTIIKIVLVILILAGLSGYLIWLKYKHQVVKNLIVNSVSDLTDSLYVLQYDSSMVDEINGDAYFGNVLLKTDSLKLNSLRMKDNLPDMLVEISIKSITAKGLDIALALSEKRLVAKEILIYEPIITIIHTGKTTFNKADSIAIFRKILGNYNSIHAERIEIVNATFTNRNSNKTINTQITQLHILYNDIVVDSTKDYRNAISYFVNNMKATANRLYVNQPKRNSAIVFDKITYTALEKFILIGKISTLREGKNEESYVLNDVKLEDLNIKDFIDENTINVGNISTHGCMLTLYLNKSDSSIKGLKKMKTFDFPDDYFDNIKIGGISIGKSKLIFKSKSNPDQPPIIVNGFQFHLSKNINISERSTLRTILDSAKWDMHADDFTIKTKDKKYDLFFKGLKVDKASSNAFINSCKVKPATSVERMASESLYQQDIYDVDMKSVQLAGLNINKFINESALSIQALTLNLNLKVYHDRIPNEQPESKVGKYPHQLLMHLALPVYIKKAIIKNSVATYKERSKKTKQTGDIVFSGIEGEVNNITNDALFIRKNPICKLNCAGLLLGKAKCSTEWRLFLDSQNGKFEVDGQIDSVNFSDFNPLTKPLALTTMEGQLNSLQFAMKGDDNGAHGNMVMLYKNLKIVSYKLSERTHQFEATNTKSLVNNLFIKNNNPSNGNIRNSSFSTQRDVKKSFFNLIWKGVNDGIQNTILDKKIADIKKQMKKNK